MVPSGPDVADKGQKFDYGAWEWESRESVWLEILAKVSFGRKHLKHVVIARNQNILSIHLLTSCLRNKKSFAGGNKIRAPTGHMPKPHSPITILYCLMKNVNIYSDSIFLDIFRQTCSKLNIFDKEIYKHSFHASIFDKKKNLKTMSNFLFIFQKICSSWNFTMKNHIFYRTFL